MTDKEYFTREEFVNMVEAYNEAEKERQILIRQIDELKAENERLKEELRNNSDVLIHEMGLKDEYQSDYVFEKLERQKYKQTLQEIKKICKKTYRKRCTNDCLGTKKHCGYGQILDKINEVIGAEG